MKTKQIIGLGIVISIIGFTTYMGVRSLFLAFKNYENLRFVSGKVVDTRMLKKVRISKYNPGIDDVLVLSIEGTHDQFGVTQGGKLFQDLLTYRKIGRTAEIYYDPFISRTIEGVLIFTPLDLKIGEVKFVDFDLVKKRYRNWSIYFLGISLFLITICWIGIKQNKKKSNASAN